MTQQNHGNQESGGYQHYNAITHAISANKPDKAIKLIKEKLVDVGYAVIANEAASRGMINVIKALYKQPHHERVNSAASSAANALSEGENEVADYILTHFCNNESDVPEFIAQAAHYGCTEIIRYFADRGYEFSNRDINAFENAVTNSHFDAAKFLIESGTPLPDCEEHNYQNVLGSPSKALKILNESLPDCTKRIIVQRHIRKSKKGIATLLNQAPDFLKSYYLSAMSGGL